MPKTTAGPDRLGSGPAVLVIAGADGTGIPRYWMISFLVFTSLPSTE